MGKRQRRFGMAWFAYVLTEICNESFDQYIRRLSECICSHSNFGSSAEAEGIQLKGDYVYFGISDKSKSDRACIYSIPKSVF